jgi:hypothetical protein
MSFLVFQTKSTAKEIIVKNIESIATLPSGLYPLKAKIKLKSSMLSYSAPLELVWPKAEDLKSPKAAVGWRSANSTFEYTPDPDFDYILSKKQINFDGAQNSKDIGKSDSMNNQDYAEQGSLVIPFQLKDTNEILLSDNLGMFKFDYEDMDLENPNIVSLEIQSPDETIIIPSILTEVLKPISNSSDKDFRTQLKLHESLDLFHAPLIEKDNLYLIKRALKLPFDTHWYFKQDGINTVFQRRLHKSLLPVETLDLVFQPNVTKETIKRVECNLRLSNLESSGSAYILSVARLPQEIVRIDDHFVLRINLGNYILSMFEKHKITFLNEIIIFYPGPASVLASVPPISRVNFQTKESENIISQRIHFLDLTKAEFRKKHLSYLIKRELALPYDNAWRYEQDLDNAVFKRRLHVDLRAVEDIRIVLNKKTPLTRFLNCRIRLGYFDDSSISEVVECNDLTREIESANGHETMKVSISDVVLKRLSQGKKKVFLQELTIFLPGRVADYLSSTRKLLHSVSFYGNYDIQKRKFSLNDDSSRQSTLLRPFGVTKVYSLQGSKKKHFEADLRLLKNYFGPGIPMKFRILVAPKSPNAKTGLHILKASTNIIKTDIFPDFIGNNFKQNENFGGPFIPEKDPNRVEQIQFKGYFPFQHLKKNQDISPFLSGPERNEKFVLFSKENVVHRVSNTREGVVIDLIFYSYDAVASLILPTVGPFKTRRLLDFDWEVDGPLHIHFGQSKTLLSNQITKVVLGEGVVPVLQLRVGGLNTENPEKGIHARLHLKNIKIGGEKILRKEDVSSPDTIVNFSGPEEFNSLQASTQNNNLSITGEKSVAQWNLPDGLVLKGQGKWVEINWKQNMRLSSISRFFLNISEGTSSIEAINIFPYSKNHSLPSFSYHPNTSQKVLSPELEGIELDGVKLLLKFKANKPFLLKLKEMAFYDVLQINYREVIDTPILIKEDTPLIPSNLKGVNNSELSINPGHLMIKSFVNEVDSKSITWATEVKKNVDQISSINLKYQMPKSMHSVSPCWLNLTFIGSKYQKKRSFCTHEHQGQIIIPIDAIFSDTNRPIEKELINVQWEILLKKGVKYHPTQSPIDLAMNFSEREIRSIRDDISLKPILKIGDSFIFPSSLTGISYENLDSTGAWINLGEINHQNSKQPFSFQVLDHPFLMIEGLLLEKTGNALDIIPVISKVGASLAGEEVKAPWWANPMVKLVIIMTIMTLGAFGLRKNFCNSLWLSLERIIKQVIRSYNSYAVKPILIKPHIVFIFGFLGVLAIAFLDTSGFSDPMSLAVATLLAGIYWNEIRRFLLNQKVFNKKNPILFDVFGIPGHDISSRVHQMVCLIMTLISYLLGSGESGQNLFWVLVSLAAPAYFYFPWWHCINELKEQFKRSFTTWLMVMGGCFYLDCIALLGGLSPAYFFNILMWNSLLLVISWPLILKKAKPLLEEKWPKITPLFYKETETQVISSILPILALVTLFRSIGLERFAEVFAVMGFFMLVLATFLKIKKLEKDF